MQTVEFFRNGKIVKGLAVTSDDLNFIREKYPFVSISQADLNNINNLITKGTVGVIMGDIEAIIDDNTKIENPDCWFVYEPEKHGYKSLVHSRFTFGEALELLKLGYKVARQGWNGKGIWVVHVPGNIVEIREGTPYWNAGLRGKIQIDGHIDMYTAQGTMQPEWLASQADMQADDWVVVNLFKQKES